MEIGLFHDNREHVLRVRDTGSGISERERRAVLQRFYRSDKVRHTSGLGLGLNLVAAIVKLHGFRFTNRPGAGCVVEIACPYAPAPMASRCVAPGGFNAGSTAAADGLTAADARPIALVAAVKANVLNTPLLAIFTAAISCLISSG